MSRSDRVQATITPVLDVMQTIPSFVYLIPVVMLLGDEDPLVGWTPLQEPERMFVQALVGYFGARTGGQ